MKLKHHFILWMDQKIYENICVDIAVVTLVVGASIDRKKKITEVHIAMKDGIQISSLNVGILDFTDNLRYFLGIIKSIRNRTVCHLFYHGSK